MKESFFTLLIFLTCTRSFAQVKKLEKDQGAGKGTISDLDRL